MPLSSAPTQTPSLSPTLQCDGGQRIDVVDDSACGFFKYASVANPTAFRQCNSLVTIVWHAYLSSSHGTINLALATQNSAGHVANDNNNNSYYELSIQPWNDVVVLRRVADTNRWDAVEMESLGLSHRVRRSNTTNSTTSTSSTSSTTVAATTTTDVLGQTSSHLDRFWTQFDYSTGLYTFGKGNVVGQDQVLQFQDSAPLNVQHILANVNIESNSDADCATVEMESFFEFCIANITCTPTEGPSTSPTETPTRTSIDPDETPTIVHRCHTRPRHTQSCALAVTAADFTLHTLTHSTYITVRQYVVSV